jgi:hypothetical protein
VSTVQDVNLVDSRFRVVWFCRGCPRLNKNHLPLVRYNQALPLFLGVCQKRRLELHHQWLDHKLLCQEEKVAVAADVV